MISILERQGKFSGVKREDDLWAGLENFWIRNDWHKNSSPHQISDMYFLFDVKNIDWQHFFSNYSVAGALNNLRKNVESLSFLEKIKLDVKDNMDLISLNFFNRWMVASKPILIRPLLISEAFYTRGESGCKKIGDIAAHDFIFGEMEHALSACNFQNEKFHVSDIIRKILFDFSVDHIVF